MIQVALLSKWHVHAVDYAREAQDHPSVAIQSVWDEDKERGKSWAEELGVPFERDLETVLSNPALDGVIVSGPTHLHTEIIKMAAKYKKHIFTEKVLAFTVEECTEIFQDIAKSNVELMISLPRLTKDYYLYAQHVLNKGLLGALTMMRCRVAHNGAVPTPQHPEGWLPSRFYNKKQCGGGALIDLGAHPIYLANRLVGKPCAITARLASMRNLGVDDHAIALLEYDSGAMAVLETSFLSAGSPFQLELYGTEGTLLIEDQKIRVKSSHFQTEDWVIPEDIPDNLPMPLEQWVEAIEKGTTPTITQQDAELLTLVNEAASHSHEKAGRVEL